jgi:hypothetical protein
MRYKMYSLQTSPPLATSDMVTWGHNTRGWNFSSCVTTAGLECAPPPSNTSKIVEVQVGAANSTFFDRDDIKVSSGTLLRFHLSWSNCSLIQTFRDLCSDDSNHGVLMDNQTLDPVNKNGTILLDYLVNTNLPQWIYPEHTSAESPCDSGQVLKINANNTQYHTELSNSSLITQTHSHCGGSQTTASDIVSYGTVGPTVASASRTFQQPLATSSLPEISNVASHVDYYIHSVVFILAMVSHFL